MIKINKYYFSERIGIIDLSEKTVIARQQEIIDFSKSLYTYGILIKDLTQIKLTKKERDKALNVAYFIIQDIKAFDTLEKKKVISAGSISRSLKLSKDFINEFKEYIIAYVLILSNPSFKHLQDVLLIKEKQDSTKDVVELIEFNDNPQKNGVTIQAGKKSAIILNAQGEFIRIKSVNAQLGGVASGEINLGLRKYKVYIIALVSLFIIIGVFIFIKYNKVDTTITVNTTSSIVYDINGGNRIIEAKSQPSKGKDLIQKINPLDKSVDSVIRDTIKYAHENNMIPNDGIVINVSGKSLEYGLLTEVKTYIDENNINVLINNNGNERKL